LRDGNSHNVKSQLCAVTVAERRQDAQSPWCHQGGGDLEPGARAGDFVFVAGMLGIDPATNTLVQDPQARIRQAFLNIKLIAQSEGASLQDCVRLTVYISNLYRFASMVDKAQEELWGKPPYPPAP